MTADAKAHTIHLIGEAKAAALQAQAQIMATHQGLIELEKIKRWDGKLPDCDNIQEIFPFINQIGTSQTSTNTFIIIPLQKPSVVKE
ncbi:hypothetical protein BGP_1814 [Beggiatoa sp. PS]|nr:hypothetical protein BGP_1814 [Beggiatoa sp. PS]